MLMVYVDASFRGRRDMASGIAALLIEGATVRGRSALGVKALNSHHAESLAVVLGLRLAVLAKSQQVTICSDSSGLVAQINKGNAIADISEVLAQMRDNGIDVSFVYANPKTNTSMAHVDYLSKSVTTE